MINNLGEIKQFYKLTKNQEENAYKLAKDSSIAGIALIVVAIFIALIFNNNQIAMATTAGGVIVEVLAGTSLFVYQKTLKQLNYYYASLHNNERFLSIINIVGKTNIKDELYQKIVESELDNLKNYESIAIFKKTDNKQKRQTNAGNPTAKQNRVPYEPRQGAGPDFGPSIHEGGPSSWTTSSQWIQIGTIGRKVQNFHPLFLQDLPDSFYMVRAHIVHHNNVSGLKSRKQGFFQILDKAFPGCPALVRCKCLFPIQSDGRKDCRCLRCIQRGMIHCPLG